MKILGIKRSQSTRSKAEWMPALTDADRPEALAPALFERIARVYGPYGRPLLDAVAADPTLGEPLVEGLPVIKAEVLHATAHEYAATLDDLFARRTMLTTTSPGRAYAPDRGGELLHWSPAECEEQHALWLRAIAQHDPFTAQKIASLDTP